MSWVLCHISLIYFFYLVLRGKVFHFHKILTDTRIRCSSCFCNLLCWAGRGIDLHRSESFKCQDSEWFMCFSAVNFYLFIDKEEALSVIWVHVQIKVLIRDMTMCNVWITCLLIIIMLTHMKSCSAVAKLLLNPHIRCIHTYTNTTKL